MRQRASELMPSAKRSANSSAARTTTMLVSKLVSPPRGLLLSACCASAALPGAGDPGGLVYQLIALACTPMGTGTARRDNPTTLLRCASSSS
jgi:hypothetical protein